MRGLCQTLRLCGKETRCTLCVGRGTGAKLDAVSLAQGARPTFAADRCFMRRVRRAPTTRISACGLTLEFTCSRRRAKPAVGCQVQRRVRPSGPHGARRRPPGNRTAQERIHGPAADVRPNGLLWGCWHEAEATKLRWPRQTKKTTGPGRKTARRRAQQVSTLDAAPRARGGARCQARTASRAAVHGGGAWKGHSV